VSLRSSVGISHSSNYGDEELLSLFGKKPKSFYNMGIRILGRSAIECSIDAHSIGMAKSIKKLKRAFFPREEARNLVAHSLKSLKDQGVKLPTNIPWFKGE
jgi:hypothetical protein